MTRTNIEPSSLVPVGETACEVVDGILQATTTRAIHDVGYNIRRDLISSFLSAPGRYRLPMRIDMRISIDVPEMLLLVGDGHVSFGSPWMENRRIEDIAEPAGKPRLFDNAIRFGAFADISVFYGKRDMRIWIDGEERYASTRERYMRSDASESGFAIGFTCTKRADMKIRSLAVTEYGDDAPDFNGTKPACAPRRPDAQEARKPTFESCIEALPPVIRSEIERTEGFLKSLHSLKFKRAIEKHGNKITYVESQRGVSYALYLSGSVMHHSIQFYIVTNGSPENWHQKSNPMEKLLVAIGTNSPELADRIFANLNECIGCRAHCLAKTSYSYRSRTKLTCHGHVFFKMCPSDFQDVRDFFAHLNRLPAE